MIADVWCPWCRDHQRAELTADRDAQRTRAEAAEAEGARLRAAAVTTMRDEREAMARICDRFAEERRSAVARLRAEGAADDDPRLAWIGCKASEAERCADAMRKGLP